MMDRITSENLFAQLAAATRAEGNAATSGIDFFAVAKDGQNIAGAYLDDAGQVVTWGAPQAIGATRKLLRSKRIKYVNR